MAARGRKSKKGSAASSKSKQRRDQQPTFFLDKCLGRFDVAEGLRNVGAKVELHAAHFSQDSPDAEWLPEVGKRGWVVLTKDRRLLTNQLEIVALLNSGAPTFVLRAADMTGSEMAMAFIKAHPAMLRFLKKFDAPFVTSVTRSGNVSILVTHDGLIRRIDP